MDVSSFAKSSIWDDEVYLRIWYQIKKVYYNLKSTPKHGTSQSHPFEAFWTHLWDGKTIKDILTFSYQLDNWKAAILTIHEFSFPIMGVYRKTWTTSTYIPLETSCIDAFSRLFSSQLSKQLNQNVSKRRYYRFTIWSHISIQWFLSQHFIKVNDEVLKLKSVYGDRDFVVKGEVTHKAQKGFTHS